MTQYARPNATITNSTWSASSGTVLYTMVDEAVADDADYIRANGSQTVELKLSAVTDPVSSATHVLNLRAMATGSGGAEKWTVTVYQGSSLIATAFNATNVTRSSFNAYSYTLSAAQADAITDYSDLRVRIVSVASAGEYVDVSYIDFNVPDKATTTHLGTATPTGTSALTVIGSLAVSGAANLVGTSSLTAAPVQAQVHEGTATLSGTSTLTGAGMKTLEGAAVLSGTSTLTGAGLKAVGGSAALSGTSTLTAAAGSSVTHSGAAVLSGVSALTATGVTYATHSGIAVLIGTSAFTGEGNIMVTNPGWLASVTMPVAGHYDTQARENLKPAKRREVEVEY